MSAISCSLGTWPGGFVDADHRKESHGPSPGRARRNDSAASSPRRTKTSRIDNRGVARLIDLNRFALTAAGAAVCSLARGVASSSDEHNGLACWR
jgi:hypothetical protein